MKDWAWGFFLRVLKRWSRSGLFELCDSILSQIKDLRVVISVGGYGPVDLHFREILESRQTLFKTLDITINHSPDILADICVINEVVEKSTINPDVIIALEVLQHVEKPANAISACHKALSDGGVLLFSTPWIIPIHDRPYDYHRFTPRALEDLCHDFTEVRIWARGNLYDSVVMLLLRGLFTGKKTGKILMLAGAVLSVMSPKPKTYAYLETIDSTIGYVVFARK